MPLLRLPLVEKLQNRLGSHGAGVFEFAVSLAHQQLSRAVNDSQGGYAFVDWDLEFLGDVAVLLAVVPDIDVHDLIVRHDGHKVGPLKREVEDVAVEAPVCSEYQQQTLVTRSGFLLGFLDLCVCVSIRRVEILFHVRRLLQSRLVGPLGSHKAPLISLLLPSLGIGDVDGLTIRQASDHFGTEDYARSIGTNYQPDDFDLHAARFESEPEACVGIGALRDRLHFDLCCRVSAVERFQGNGVSGENGVLPLLEWGEAGIRGGCGLRAAGCGDRSGDDEGNNDKTGHRKAPNQNHSSRKWRPVKRTKTSSRLAWRVVRCRNSLPCALIAASSAGMVRCGSFTLSATRPSSSRTDSTLGRLRHAALSAACVPS